MASFLLIFSFSLFVYYRIDYSEENAENAPPAVRNTPFKVGGAGATPKGKHIVFSSPELKVGNGVHWNYDSFDKAATAPSNTPAAPTQAPSTPAAAASVKFMDIEEREVLPSDLLLNAMTPGKLKNKQDQINFWLSKGPKTPIR